jgi:hypothetical protein
MATNVPMSLVARYGDGTNSPRWMIAIPHQRWDRDADYLAVSARSGAGVHVQNRSVLGVNGALTRSEVDLADDLDHCTVGGMTNDASLIIEVDVGLAAYAEIAHQIE